MPAFRNYDSSQGFQFYQVRTKLQLLFKLFKVDSTESRSLCTKRFYHLSPAQPWDIRGMNQLLGNMFKYKLYRMSFCYVTADASITRGMLSTIV